MKQTLLAVLFTTTCVNVFAQTIRNADMFSLDNNQPVERLATTINGQRYYQSTGVNSQFPGMVFPFVDINEETGYINKLGMDDRQFVEDTIQHRFIDQLQGADKTMFVMRLNSAVRERYQDETLTWRDAIYRDYTFRQLFARLYSVDMARVSFAFHTGEWANPEGDSFVQALDTYFTNDEGYDVHYNFKESPEAYFNLNTVGGRHECNQFLTNFNGLQ